MKILKIEFQNINSLKGFHEIDFTDRPFTGSSLFAITGPTGSGKSTILDVISLALFNQVPRLGKISKSEIISKGAILTRNQKEATARVTYESKNGIFASQWSISTARTGNLRDYEMQIFDLATEKALDLKKSDVPGKNEELIGLNYDQFIKSVLLAQGEFAQFLRAKKDERGELLEKITGTGIYRQVGIKAFQKFKEVNSEIDAQQKQSLLLRQDLLEEEQFESFSKSLSEKEQSSSLFEKEIRQLEQKVQLKQQINEQAQQITRQEKEKETAEAELKKFISEHGIPLQKHEKIQIFAEDLRNWKSLKEACKELKNDLSENLQKDQKNKGNITGCLEKIREFIKEDSEAENIEQDLQHFSESVRKLQKHRDEKLATYKNLNERFDLELREVPFRLNGDLESTEDKLKELYAITQVRIGEIQRSLPEVEVEELEPEKQRLKTKLEKTRKAQQQSVKLEKLSEEISAAQEEQKSLVPRLEELPKKIKLAGAKVELLSERLEKLNLKQQNQLLQASLEEHRLHLKNGEPCPLCGALEHPYAKDLPAPEEGLQVQLKGAEKELAAYKNQVTAHKTTLEHLEERVKKLKEKEQATQRELQVQKGDFDAQFRELQPEEGSTWEDLCDKYEFQLQQMEQYGKESKKLEAISAGFPLLKELKTVLVEGREIKERLDGLYSGKDINTDCLELQNSWRGFQHSQKSLAEQAKELQTKLDYKFDQLEELENDLSPKLKKKGCEEIPEALDDLLPEGTYNELRQKREALTSKKGKIGAALETLRNQLKNLQERDVEKTAEALQTELREKQEKFRFLREECEEFRRKLRNDRELRTRIEKLESGLKEKKKRIRRWELLNQLIGDSTGKKFNDFAQDLSLSQLLQLANLRLKDLSDRYKMDKPSSEEDDGLVAIDEHMGGQRRSVKTLSGGETFILSLSMALALSDLASKNVEINSLFIDEGFGTLDPETLDQTLDTLEKLQAESSKTIGIISHVDSLKERIATQIQLKRNGQGYSSLELIG